MKIQHHILYLSIRFANEPFSLPCKMTKKREFDLWGKIYNSTNFFFINSPGTIV